MHKFSCHFTTRASQKGKRVLYIVFALLIPSIILSLGMDVLKQDARVLAEPILVKRMIMPFDAKVHITINNAISNSCDGDFGISTPENRELVQNYNSKRGTTVVVGPFDEGEELVFYIEPHSFCSGHRYESTNPNHARVHEIAGGIWRIEWEDLPDYWPPDNDFDDLIVTIRLAGAYPDFKQNTDDWADDIYDHNDQPEDDIASWGCALTSAANLLALYGARDINPGALNTYLTDRNGGYSARGGVVWTAIDDYMPPDSDVSVMDYSRRLYPGNPNIDLTAEITRSISNTWPVIFEYGMPSSPSGVHFLVATAVTETTTGESAYVMKDPISGTTSIEQIPFNDTRIRSAIFYEPSDQLARPDTIIYGYSPIELLIIDSLGRKLGYDALNGEYVWEIPDGYYGYEDPYWNPIDESRTGQVGGALVTELPGLPRGSYQLLVHGTGTGDFELEMLYDHGHGEIHSSQVSGDVQTGTAIAYDLRVGSTWLSATPDLRIDLFPDTQSIYIGGHAAIAIALTDGSGNAVPGEIISLNSTLGTISPTTITDSDGMAVVTFSGGTTAGTASITAQTSAIATNLNIEVLRHSQFLPIAINQQP